MANERYQLRGYLVPPLSIKAIRGIADTARQALRLPDYTIPMELFLESLFHFGIIVDVIEESEMPGYPAKSEAYCIPDRLTIYLTVETYSKACKNDSRALFTIFHELGHLLLGHSRELHRGQIPRDVKCYLDSEWQADQFAAEMTMPLQVIVEHKLYSTEAIRKRFGVSALAAQKRYTQLTNLKQIK